MKLNANRSIIGGITAFIFATSCCWLPALIVGVGGTSGMLLFAEGVEKFSSVLMVISTTLLLYGGYLYYKKGSSNIQSVNAILLSTSTCPECRHQKVETMPTNACTYFYECDNCKMVIKPKTGDCCVYCSYGTVPCPPIQLNQNCC